MRKYFTKRNLAESKISPNTKRDKTRDSSLLADWLVCALGWYMALVDKMRDLCAGA